MKKIIYSVLAVLCFASACTSNPDTHSSATASNNSQNTETKPLKEVFYERLDANKCMNILFKDFETDSARVFINYHGPIPTDDDMNGPIEESKELEEQATGDIDTTWFWKPSNVEAISQRYKNGLDVSKLTKQRVEYLINDYCATKSAISLLYYISNTTSTNFSGYGLAIFRKSNKGWFLSKNDFNFYEKIPLGMDIKRFEDAGTVNGTPAFLFVCESTNVHAPLSRQLFLTSYDLSPITPSANALFEINEESNVASTTKMQNAGLTLSVDRSAKQIIADSMAIGSDYLVKYQLNYRGDVVALKYYARSSTTSKPGLQLLLNGSIIENSAPFREGKQGPKSYAPSYRIVGLWKNYVTNKSLFFTGTRFHAYAQGSLDDSVSVKAAGQEKLLARQKINEENARDAEAFNRNSERVFQSVRTAQMRDQTERELGLCTYCHGKGCLQCGHF